MSVARRPVRHRYGPDPQARGVVSTHETRKGVPGYPHLPQPAFVVSFRARAGTVSGMSDDTKAARRRFARVYYDDLERDYPGLFYDPTALSTWLRLLVLSEKAWPALPELPKAVRRSDLDKLVSLGIFEHQPHSRFVLRGWVKDREARAEHGKKAVGSRKDRPTWVPTRVTTPVVSPVVPRGSLSTSTSTSSQETEGGPGGTIDPFDAYWSLTTRYPKGGGATWLDRLTATFGAEPVVRTLGAKWIELADASTLLSRTEDALLHDARVLDQSAQKAERERIAAKRAEPRAVVDREAVNAELRRLMGLDAA